MKSANSQRSGEKYSHTKSERYIYNNTGGGLGCQTSGFADPAYQPIPQYATFDSAGAAVEYAPSYESAQNGKRAFIPKHWIKNEEA